MNSTIVGLGNKRSNSTIVGLIAAIAVLSGGLGLSLTEVIDDQKLMTSNAAAGFLMGHLEIEAHNADGELVAYRQSDNEVVDDGEQCILKMLFSVAQVDGANNGRGQYASTSLQDTGACKGILTGAWDVIAIGTGTDMCPQADGFTMTKSCADLGDHDKIVKMGVELTANDLQRAAATTKTWTNGSGGDDTKIVLKNTFTSSAVGATAVTESGLFNSTTASQNGMLAHQTFGAVSIANGDSITVTWTFTVGN